MQVILTSPRGFCAGVVRAVEVVDLCLKRFGAPVYVKHQIVHNPYVVASLERKGAVTVEEVNEIPEGSVVVFSAHGSPPEDFRQAEDRGLTVIDATCPLVTRVHNEAAKYDRDGRRILLVGHRDHQEVRGHYGPSEHGPCRQPREDRPARLGPRNACGRADPDHSLSRRHRGRGGRHTAALLQRPLSVTTSAMPPLTVRLQ